MSEIQTILKRITTLLESINVDGCPTYGQSCELKKLSVELQKLAIIK